MSAIPLPLTVNTPSINQPSFIVHEINATLVFSVSVVWKCCAASCCSCSLNIGARSSIPLFEALGCTLTWKEPKSNTKRKPVFATLVEDATSINRCPIGVYWYGWSSIVIAIFVKCLLVGFLKLR